MTDQIVEAHASSLSMTLTQGTILIALIALAASTFLGVVIWRKNPPAPAFWSFAILSSVPLVVLLIAPVVFERIAQLSEITTTKEGTIYKFGTGLVDLEKRIDDVKAQVKQLTSELGKTGKTITPGPTTGWILERFGDCAGRDKTSTAGADPVPDLCQSAGTTAVCWDGATFVNRSQFGGGAWCTYKNIPSTECVGGGAPGRVYGCAPKS